MILSAVIWTFQRSNALKNCKKTDRVLHGMIIYEIIRHIIDIKLNCNLSCTFPSGNRLITVVLNFRDQSKEILKFELDPETPIKVSMPLKLLK